MALDDALLFDKVLEQAGLTPPDMHYPPMNTAALELLLEKIFAWDKFKRDAVVYYLLKWYPKANNSPERFAKAARLPPSFTALSDAYWALDNGIAVNEAVSLLADVRLTKDNAAKIIQALSLDAPHLIVKFIRTAKPSLEEPEVVIRYATALADNAFFEAWQFQRTFNQADPLRNRIIQHLFEWIVTPSPRAAALEQLMSLPMTNFESGILHTFALRPPDSVSPKCAAVLQDLVCIRLLQAGRHADAIKTDRQFSAASTLKGSPEYTQDRSKMVREVYLALPQVERTLLDMELAEQDSAMDMSWEDLGNVPLDKSFRKPTNNRRKSLGSTLKASAPISSPSASLLSTSISAKAKVSANGISTTSSNPFISSGPSRARNNFGSSISARQPLFSSVGGGQSSVAAPKTSIQPHANAFYQPPMRDQASPFTFSGMVPPQGDMDVEEEEDEAYDGMPNTGSIFENLVPSRPEGLPAPTPAAQITADVDQDMEEERRPVNGNAKTRRHVNGNGIANGSGSAHGSGKANVSANGNAHANGDERAQLSRSQMPGGFGMDDEEVDEEDEVPPLPPPSPKKRSSARRSVAKGSNLSAASKGSTGSKPGSTAKSRSTRANVMSVDSDDEHDGPQTRRRSSRLNAAPKKSASEPAKGRKKRV
ncbi:hypothetical protein CYLTODRAFT_370884 [Cylindrobasidium torrendii FP15055 ss-10]|uniref:ELYS-like domain-containing protein n=1 Tax=Cylindrobasidium torrendii FP15055 ss-10 TaxID=1314674 RepID=A0A0D7BIT9_9AGAR|nr:hypothetical protein CYLTODRAFT_370884 [Cylindrobasidium torrendii FP15055 ss-10]